METGIVQIIYGKLKEKVTYYFVKDEDGFLFYQGSEPKGHPISSPPLLRCLLFSFSQECHYCNKVLTLPENGKGDGKHPPKDFPTIDHVYSSWHPKQFEGKNQYKVVLACPKCNHSDKNRWDMIHYGGIKITPPEMKKRRSIEGLLKRAAENLSIGESRHHYEFLKRQLGKNVTQKELNFFLSKFPECEYDYSAKGEWMLYNNLSQLEEGRLVYFKSSNIGNKAWMPLLYSVPDEMLYYLAKGKKILVKDVSSNKGKIEHVFLPVLEDVINYLWFKQEPKHLNLIEHYKVAIEVLYSNKNFRKRFTIWRKIASKPVTIKGVTVHVEKEPKGIFGKVVESGQTHLPAKEEAK